MGIPFLKSRGLVRVSSYKNLLNKDLAGDMNRNRKSPLI